MGIKTLPQCPQALSRGATARPQRGHPGPPLPVDSLVSGPAFVLAEPADWADPAAPGWRKTWTRPPNSGFRGTEGNNMMARHPNGPKISPSSSPQPGRPLAQPQKRPTRPVAHSQRGDSCRMNMDQACPTGFSSDPMPEISMHTVSPALSQTGGVRAKPTPAGVPVRMTAPGRKVMVELRDSIRVGTS